MLLPEQKNGKIYSARSNRIRQITNALRCSILFILSALCSPKALAVDATIRVLAVLSPTGDPSRVDGAMGSIEGTWAGSSISSSVSITLVNNGVPELISIGNNGLVFDQYNLLMTNGMPVPALEALRNEHQADVVIFFTNSNDPQYCGYVGSEYWRKDAEADIPPAFVVSDLPGLDLRGRNSSFLAVVSTNSFDCGNRRVAAHEFGHVLGGGHADKPALTTWDPWLYSDSRAHVKIIPSLIGDGNEPRNTGTKTIMALGTPSGYATDLISNGRCTFWSERFSENTPGFGNDSAENIRAINKTALSVANFFPGVPTGGGDDNTIAECNDGLDNDSDGFIDLIDQGCTFSWDNDEFNGDNGGNGDGDGDGGSSCNSLVPPTFLTAQATGCLYILSLYQVAWLHQCPSEVDTYTFQKRQPNNIFNPWVAEGFPTAALFSNWWVTGAPAGVRVRACGSAGCSLYSTETVTLNPYCGGIF